MATPQEELANAYKAAGVSVPAATQPAKLSPEDELKAAYSSTGNNASFKTWKTKALIKPPGSDKFQEGEVVQREDLGTWRGPAEGNTGKAGWFDAAGNRLSNIPGKELTAWETFTGGEANKGPATQIQDVIPAVTAAVVKPVAGLTQSALHLAGDKKAPFGTTAKALDTAAGYVDTGINKFDNWYERNPNFNAAPNIELGTQIGLMGAGEVALASRLAPTLAAVENPTTAGLAKTILSYGKSIGKSALANGAIIPAITPEANYGTEEDYTKRKQDEALAGGKFGAVVGGLLHAPGLATVVAKEGSAALRKIPNPLNPNIIYTGNPLSENIFNKTYMEATGTVPPANSIPALQRLASEGNLEAAEALKQIRMAASKEHGVPLSKADITQNPSTRASEEAMGGRMTNFRNSQAQSVNRAVTTIEDTAAKALPEGVDASGAIQSDIARRYTANKEWSRKNYETLNSDITKADDALVAQGLPSANVVAVDPVIAEIDRILAEETPRPAVITELNRIRTQLSENPLNFKQASGIISNIESSARDLGLGSIASPSDSNGARLLGGVSRKLSGVTNKTAEDLLGSLDKVKEASKFHREHVVPFTDPATGLPQILDTPYADKATRAFLQTASPEQIKMLASKLSKEGNAALKVKLLQAARETGEKGLKGTRGLNPGAWADYLARHGDVLEEVLPPKEINSLQGLVHLAQSTKAGIEANPSLGHGVARRIITSIAGHGVGGPFGSIAMPIAEGAVEGALGSIRAGSAINPNIVSNTPKDRVTQYLNSMGIIPDPLEVQAQRVNAMKARKAELLNKASEIPEGISTLTVEMPPTRPDPVRLARSRRMPAEPFHGPSTARGHEINEALVDLHRKRGYPLLRPASEIPPEPPASDWTNGPGGLASQILLRKRGTFVPTLHEAPPPSGTVKGSSHIFEVSDKPLVDMSPSELDLHFRRVQHNYEVAGRKFDLMISAQEVVDGATQDIQTLQREAKKQGGFVSDEQMQELARLRRMRRDAVKHLSKVDAEKVNQSMEKALHDLKAASPRVIKTSGINPRIQALQENLNLPVAPERTLQPAPRAAVNPNVFTNESLGKSLTKPVTKEGK